MYVKNHVIIFGGFLGIRENAEWLRFGPPGVHANSQRSRVFLDFGAARHHW